MRKATLAYILHFFQDLPLRFMFVKNIFYVACTDTPVQGFRKRLKVVEELYN